MHNVLQFRYIHILHHPRLHCSQFLRTSQNLLQDHTIRNHFPITQRGEYLVECSPHVEQLDFASVLKMVVDDEKMVSHSVWELVVFGDQCLIAVHLEHCYSSEPRCC